MLRKNFILLVFFIGSLSTIFHLECSSYKRELILGGIGVVCLGAGVTFSVFEEIRFQEGLLYEKGRNQAQREISNAVDDAAQNSSIKVFSFFFPKKTTAIKKKVTSELEQGVVTGVSEEIERCRRTEKRNGSLKTFFFSVGTVLCFNTLMDVLFYKKNP